MGKWYATDKGEEVYLTFYKDGQAEMVSSKESTKTGSYRFVDDNTIEMSVSGGERNPRAHVSFPSKDTLVVNFSDGGPVTFARVSSATSPALKRNREFQTVPTSRN